MYRVAERKQHASRLFMWAALILVVGIATCVAAYTLIPQKPIAAKTIKAAPKPYAVEARSSTLFFGNAYFSRYINDHAMASPLKYAYPFSRLNEFHREQYDAWVTGLECPTVAGFQQTSAQEDATLSFNCSPDYLPEMAKWFSVVTLANNHTDNRGAEGFAETKKHLDQNHIQYFGHYDPRELSDICDVIALPATIQTSDKKEQKGALPVAMCGYHWFIRMAQPDSLAVMKEYSQYMPVLAFPHGGTEYKTAPDNLKTTLYRSMIDNGADVVLGDHPHVVQPSESYKGHPIFYSMGNFIFDQQVAPEMTRSAGIHIVFNVKGADKTQLAQWLAVGKTCSTYHDDCLNQIKKQSLHKLPYAYTVDIVGTDDLGYITKPASAQVQQGILDRLNWSQTKTQLQQPYAAL
jgi:poly-gamma-glutamate synthesis protein (capsule biosynthesis protein)